MHYALLVVANCLAFVVQGTAHRSSVPAAARAGYSQRNLQRMRDLPALLWHRRPHRHSSLSALLPVRSELLAVVITILRDIDGSLTRLRLDLQCVLRGQVAMGPHVLSTLPNRSHSRPDDGSAQHGTPLHRVFSSGSGNDSPSTAVFFAARRLSVCRSGYSTSGWMCCYFTSC